MTWSFDDNLPIYLQIIRILKYELARGKYQPGEKLPAVRELAMTWPRWMTTLPARWWKT